MTTFKPSEGRRISSPLSLRVTQDERAKIEAAAGDKPVSVYIRARLFTDSVNNVPSESFTETERLSPETRQRLLAQILGILGQSGVFRSLSELAEAARIGVLPLTPDVLEEVKAACSAIIDIRRILLRAVGLKPAEGGPHDPER